MAGAMAVELCRVGVYGAGWNPAASLGALLVLAFTVPILLGLLAFGGGPAPTGYLVTDPELIARIARLAAEARVRPPEQIRLTTGAELEWVPAHRLLPFRTPRRAFRLGVGAAATLPADAFEALLVEALARDPLPTSTDAVAVALIDLASTRPLPSGVDGAGMRLQIAIVLAVLALSFVPRATLGGVCWPLVRVRARLDGERAAAGERLAVRRLGEEGLASARAALAEAEALALVLEDDALLARARWRQPLDTVIRHVRLARTRGRASAEPWWAPTDELAAQVGASEAQGFPGVRVAEPSAAGVSWTAAQLSITRGPPMWAEIVAAAAELPERSEDALAARCALSDGDLERIAAWDALRLDVARLRRYWRVDADHGVLDRDDGEPVTRSSAVEMVGLQEARLERAAKDVRADLLRRLAAFHGLATLRGPTWVEMFERSVAVCVTLRALRDTVDALHALVRVPRSASRLSWSAVEAAWAPIRALVGELDATAIGVPRVALAEIGPSSQRGWKESIARALEAWAELGVAEGAAWDHLLDLTDRLVLAQDGEACEVPELAVPADPPVPRADRPPPKIFRKPRPLVYAPQPVAMGATGLLVVTALGCRVLGGTSALIVYNGTPRVVRVEVGGQEVELPPLASERWSFLAPRSVTASVALNGEVVEEGAVEIDITPRQWVYNIGGYGVLGIVDTVYTPDGGPAEPYPTRLLGVGPLVATTEEEVLVEMPATMEVDANERARHRPSVQDLRAGHAAYVTLVYLASPTAESGWAGDGAWSEIRAEQLATALTASLRFDAPDGWTAMVRTLARQLELPEAEALIEAQDAEARRRAELEDSPDAWVSYAWIAPAEEAERSVGRALAVAPDHAGAVCVRALQLSRDLAWDEAGPWWERCEGLADESLARSLATERLLAARWSGRPLDAILAQVGDEELDAALGPSAPDDGSPALRGGWLLAHGELTRAAAVATNAGLADLALLVGLSDDGPLTGLEPAEGAAPFWREVALARAGRVEGPFVGVDLCDLDAVEAAIRGTAPAEQGASYAAAAVLAGGCRPPEVVRRAQRLGLPGQIPWFRDP
ncbi:MAG: hypothetical protein H6735_32515 [Alphaproteobacteria bacterium]|nr:hypothetical protein [Alphaproteobacteria bacterium]